jgi:ATP-dependent Zn protease
LTGFLVSETNPNGYRLEDILSALRKDILTRCTKIVDDQRPEARHVLENNMKILNLISEAISLAEDSTKALDRSFGPSAVASGGAPRIGKP